MSNPETLMIGMFLFEYSLEYSIIAVKLEDTKWCTTFVCKDPKKVGYITMLIMRLLKVKCRKCN